MDNLLPLTSPFVIGAALGVAGGASLLGVFMILRRMSLVADAFSHVALPGIALGLLLHFSPFLGALLFLIAAAFALQYLESSRAIAPETTLGVVFTAALALGLLLTPSEELLETLFGDVSHLTSSAALFTAAGGVALLALTLAFFRNFALLTLSPELAQMSNGETKRSSTLFFLILAFAVALGITFSGVLLIGALIVLPSATAKNLAAGLRSMVIMALAIGVGGTGLGVLAAARVNLPPGPVIVLALTVFFLASLLTRRRL